MIKLIDFMMQHFLPGVILNMLFGLILSLKLIILGIFVNKGIETIILPSIFKDKSIPADSENKESPIFVISTIHYSCAVLIYNK